MEYFYKITIYFRSGKPVSEIRRFGNNRRGDIEEAALIEAKKKYKSDVHRVDAWIMPENHPEVVEYRKKWL